MFMSSCENGFNLLVNLLEKLKARETLNGYYLCLSMHLVLAYTESAEITHLLCFMCSETLEGKSTD